MAPCDWQLAIVVVIWLVIAILGAIWDDQRREIEKRRMLEEEEENER